MAPAAHAAGVQVCLVSEVDTFSPPLTDSPPQVPITITFHGQLSGCTSGSARTGSYTERVVDSTATCTNILDPSSGTRILDWTNTGTTPSTFSFNSLSTLVNGTLQVESLGSITSGTFTPDPATEVLTGPVLSLTACADGGVSARQSAGVLTIGV